MSAPASYINPNTNVKQQPNNAYQSTRAFASGAGALYTYSTSLNSSFQTVGSLVINTSSSAGNCPVNRVVHANGKVLVPGANPGGGAGVSPATGTGSTTPNPLPFPMIGVYDPVSGLNGFINPQDPTWAVYNAAMPAIYDQGLAAPATTLGGQGAEPRFAGVATATSAGTGGAATASVGSAHTGLITVATATAPTTITVSSTEVTASSVILLTLQSATSTSVLRVGATIVAGTSFQIIASAALAAADVIYFTIIN